MIIVLTEIDSRRD